MKPILFNTEMVRAILDGRKTVTRRVIKAGARKILRGGTFPGAVDWSLKVAAELDNHGFVIAPYQPGDTLYVRETFNYGYFESSDIELDTRVWFEPLPIGERVLSRYGFVYKADFSEEELYEYGTENCEGDLIPMPWKPSIHMPKEAARLFLRVTDVRAQRLQDMTTDDAKAEGAETDDWLENCEEASAVGLSTWSLREYFGYHIWDRTLNGKETHDRYGWDANPFVWVIDFERCEKPKGE